MSAQPKPHDPGKIHDPVFLCMIAAVILAVVSSIALRALVSRAGPAAARGDTTDTDTTTDTDNNQPKPHHTTTIVNAQPK